MCCNGGTQIINYNKSGMSRDERIAKNEEFAKSRMSKKPKEEIKEEIKEDANQS